MATTGTAKGRQAHDPAATTAGSGTHAELQQLLDDLFHALNQPLAALRCALELGLYQCGPEEKHHKTFEAALSRVEDVSRMTNGIRTLVQAEDPGDELATVTLDRFLREAVEDWAPVAEAAGTKLVLQVESACPVRFEPCRLQQALFHLLEFLMGSAGQSGAIHITLRAENSEAVLEFAIACGEKKDLVTEESEKEKNLKELKRQLSLAIAQRMFAAASAVWRTESHDQKLEIELRLPLAAR